MFYSENRKLAQFKRDLEYVPWELSYTVTCTTPILMTTLPGKDQCPHVTGKETKDQRGKVAQPHQSSKYALTQDPSQVSLVLVTTTSTSLTLKMTF